MSTGASERSRRSPRLAKSEEVKLAAKHADGSLVVEATRTLDISKHGAALNSQHSFPLGAAIALRRARGKPMRGRVVSCRPCPDGRYALGIEFVEGEGDWELEFPKEWQDSYRPSEPMVSGAESKARQPDQDALEALVVKAEALRAQADSLLAEFQSKLEAQRRQDTADLTLRTEKLRVSKSTWETEVYNQILAAKKSIGEHIERSLAQFQKTSEGWQRKVDDLRGQVESALKSFHETLGQQRMSHEKQGAELLTQQAATLETHRREMAEIEARVLHLGKQSAAQLEQIRQDARQAHENTAREIQSAAQGAIKESQDRLPSLKDEFLRTLAPLITEQQSAACRAVEHSLEALRASGSDLESQHRRMLADSQRIGLEQHQAEVQRLLEEFSRSGEAALSPLEARFEQARLATAEALKAAENSAAKARDAMTAGLAQTAARLQELSQERIAGFQATEVQIQKRLEESGEAQQQAALDAIRKIDQSALDLEALAAALHQVASKDKQELDSQFASLMGVYENRKATLDRLLGTVEDARTSVRTELEKLRVDVEEHRAGLGRLAADQAAVLKAQLPELGRTLQKAVAALEASLETRITATLESARVTFAKQLEEDSGSSQNSLRAALAAELATAMRRVPELAAMLESRQQELDRGLEQATAGHLNKLREAGADGAQQAVRHGEELAKSTSAHQESIQRMVATTQTEIAERTAAATGSINTLLAAIEQQRLSITRLQADTEGQIQRTTDLVVRAIRICAAFSYVGLSTRARVLIWACSAYQPNAIDEFTRDDFAGLGDVHAYLDDNYKRTVVDKLRIAMHRGRVEGAIGLSRIAALTPEQRRETYTYLTKEFSRGRSSEDVAVALASFDDMLDPHLRSSLLPILIQRSTMLPSMRVAELCRVQRALLRLDLKDEELATLAPHFPGDIYRLPHALDAVDLWSYASYRYLVHHPAVRTHVAEKLATAQSLTAVERYVQMEYDIVKAGESVLQQKPDAPEQLGKYLILQREIQRDLTRQRQRAAVVTQALPLPIELCELIHGYDAEDYRMLTKC